MTIRVAYSDLPAVGITIHQAVQDALIESGQAILLDAADTVPVDTGNLRATHELVDGERAKEAGAVSNAPDDLIFSVQAGGPTEEAPEGAHYSLFVHDGTHKMPARPWLEQAAENERDLLPERIRTHVERKL